MEVATTKTATRILPAVARFAMGLGLINLLMKGQVGHPVRDWQSVIRITMEINVPYVENTPGTNMSSVLNATKDNQINCINQPLEIKGWIF